MSKLKNEIGNRYFYLEVIERMPNKNNKVYWKCRCDCGREHIVSGTNLRTGAVKSCGKCINNNQKQDLTGKVFGVLEVIEENPGSKRASWKCKCVLCGKEIVVDGTNLKTGHTKSCSCITGSTGEAVIASVLKNNNIKFQQQYSFNDFKLSTGGIPKFDFAIFDKNNLLLCLIEYDGEQHYVTTGGWNNEKCHNLTIIRDNEKTEYCKKNNIPLIRIPYYDLNQLSLLYILKKIQEIKNNG